MTLLNHWLRWVAKCVSLKHIIKLLIERPKTDQDRTLGKNLLKELIRLLHKLAKSVTKTSSKLRKPKIYNKLLTILFMKTNGKKL